MSWASEGGLRGASGGARRRAGGQPGGSISGVLVPLRKSEGFEREDEPFLSILLSLALATLRGPANLFCRVDGRKPKVTKVSQIYYPCAAKLLISLLKSMSAGYSGL